MMRLRFPLAVCLALWGLGGALPPASAAELFPEQAANAHGLTRAWFAQAPIDPARGHITHVILAEGTLFVQTHSAMVLALNAETGQTLWSVQVGTPDYPNFPLDARGDFVAVVNGSTLYILSRYDGKLLWQKRLEGCPAAGAGLSDRHVFVPLVSELIYAYPLRPVAKPVLKLENEEERKPATPTAGTTRPRSTASNERSPAATNGQEAAADETASAAEDEQERRSTLRLSQEYIVGTTCPSIGQAFTRPLVTVQTTGQENITWTTTRGFLFTGKLVEDHFAGVYRLSTGGPISTEPTYLPGDENDVSKPGVLFGSSEDGFVYAVRESNGNILWRFSAADPISERTAVIGRRIYVPTETEGMYCLNAENGEQIWWLTGIRRFLAASKERLYTIDATGHVSILNAQTGGRLDAFELPKQTQCLTNDMTDRLYVYAPSGLIQCLREVDQVEAIQHREVLRQTRAKEAEEQPEAKKAPAPSGGHAASLPAPTVKRPSEKAARPPKGGRPPGPGQGPGGRRPPRSVRDDG